MYIHGCFQKIGGKPPKMDGENIMENPLNKWEHTPLFLVGNTLIYPNVFYSYISLIQLWHWSPSIQLWNWKPSGHDIKARLVHTLSKDRVLGFLRFQTAAVRTAPSAASVKKIVVAPKKRRLRFQNCHLQCHDCCRKLGCRSVAKRWEVLLIVGCSWCHKTQTEWRMTILSQRGLQWENQSKRRQEKTSPRNHCAPGAVKPCWSWS